MKTRISLVSAALVASLGLSPLASAGHRDDRASYDGYATAKVIQVRPIVRMVTVNVPQRECWDEVVTQRRSGGRDNSAGRMILGGIVGGVIGSRFGGGRGKDIATVAGTLIGASVGHDMAGRSVSRQGGYTTVTEQTCRVSHVQTIEERVEAYRVSYRYKGEVYTTQMAYDPGDRIPVKVEVKPVHKRRF